MASFHVTFHFSQPPLSGWREQLWWEGADQTSCLAAAIKLAQARYSILGAGVTLYRVVVAVPGIPRATLTANIQGIPLPYNAMPAVQAINVRLLGNATPPHRRSYALHGMPVGSLFLGPGPVDWAPFIRVAAQAWLSLLVGTGWRILATVSVGQPVGIAGLTVADIATRDIYGGPRGPATYYHEPQLLFIETDTPPAVPASLARIYGLKFTPKVRRLGRQINGTRALVGWISDGIYVIGSTWGLTDWWGGTVQMQIQLSVPIASTQVIGYVSRKVGKGKPPAPNPTPPLTPVITPGISGPPHSFPAIAANPPLFVAPTNTYQTARDIAVEVFNGYSDTGGMHQKTIGLAHASNQPVDTWVVFVPGVDVGSVADNFDEWISGLEAWLGIEDDYTAFLEATLKKKVPPNSRVFWCGHSLGGMSCQWARRNRGQFAYWQSIDLVSFGSPVFRSPYLNVPTIGLGSDQFASQFAQQLAPRDSRHFGYRLDPCVYLSPGGSWAWLRILSIARTAGQGAVVDLIGSLTIPAWTTILSPPAGVLPNLFKLHMQYNTDTQLDDWNWKGASDPTKALPPLTTGPVTRFLYVPGG